MSKSPPASVKKSDGEPDIPEQDDAVIGRAFRWSIAVISCGALLAAAVAFWMNQSSATIPVRQTPLALPEAREHPTIPLPELKFIDVTDSAGIDFTHANGAYGDKLLPETMGGGCAFLDFDNDGDQDLLFVDSRAWPWRPQPDSPKSTVRLYSNDGSGHFADVTTNAGLDCHAYGMGVAVGDFDNDGWSDLFVTAVGSNHLFRNNQGKFQDVTRSAGVGGAPTQWSTGSAWLDFDNDDDLDLFVANYVRWNREIDLAQEFSLLGHGRAYGPPMSFEGTFPYLYRNEGGGTFTDVSASAGVQIKNPSTGLPMAKSLGVAPIDLDHDGWIDLIVANDTVQNFLFRNRRDGTFEEIGAVAGVAFDERGNARGAMGIDTGYFRNDGTLGVAIGNFANEMTALYCTEANSLQFTDDAIATGLAPLTRLVLTFGLFFFDADLDGRLDLFSANGHLEQDIHKVQHSQQYRQPAQLYWNCGTGQKAQFQLLLAEKCGADLATPMVGRGATYADIDGDGDLDVLMTSVGDRPKLLRNDQRLGHHWLRFRLIGHGANRDAIGAWVEVRIGKDLLRRQVMPTKSYLSQSELPVTIGLGDSRTVDSVTVIWPGGRAQEVPAPNIDGLTIVEQSSTPSQ